MKQGFIPDSATIARREDGAWDMVALFRMGETVTEMKMILADATFTLESFYSQASSSCPCDLCSYIPCGLEGFRFDLTSALRPGVDGMDGIYLRQRIIEGECDSGC